MPGLTIGWEYLTGCCVATDPASRQRAEWPPHPGRVFMALAAAWFETEPSNDAPDRKDWEDEGDSLQWLERLGDGNRRDPQLILPPECDVSLRKVVTVFVPVNGDRAKDTFPEEKAGTLQSAPSIARKKNDRTFPTVWVGDSPCFLHWPHVGDEAIEPHRAALQRLCGKVTRIGHSSSLVRMWLAEGSWSPGSANVWVPDDGLADFHVRRVSGGTLDLLERQFNGRGRAEHARLTAEIESLVAQKKTIRGKGAAGLKAGIDAQIEDRRGRLRPDMDRPPIRPKLGLWTGYRRQQAMQSAPVAHSDFDSDLLILTQVGGPRLPLASTLAVTQALRGAVMSQSVQPPPSWVSGHVEDCQPLRDGRQHLAYVPLPVVGSEYADGHLLGAALVFPHSIPRQERGRVLGRLLLDTDGRAKQVRLTLGPLGEWALVKRDWSESRHGLKPETWTAHPHGATTWATVTPVVLDRFPKADAMKERAKWEVEVADIVATACGRLGLPGPAEIRFGTTSWHRGSPRASAKRRPLRGQDALAGTATLGDGFPTYPAKGSNGVRPQLHVFVRFAEPVVGPVLLCAGRFLGYGLCKPFLGGVGP